MLTVEVSYESIKICCTFRMFLLASYVILGVKLFLLLCQVSVCVCVYAIVACDVEMFIS
jgi:hypothetical protein